MHGVDIGFFGFLSFVAYMIIWGFISHFLAAKNPDSTLGKAIMFING